MKNTLLLIASFFALMIAFAFPAMAFNSDGTPVIQLTCTVMPTNGGMVRLYDMPNAFGDDSFVLAVGTVEDYSQCSDGTYNYAHGGFDGKEPRI